ncbi:MAG: response regulator [Chloroflexi bacterium]|nr:response regulator [Chloroflexota bacterium]
MTKTILLADDEESLRLLVHATVEDSGYSILEAADGESALALTLRHRPDLLVLDWMMPRLSGLEVLRTVRATAETAHTPVIMLTARSQAGDREHGEAAGANAYLTKPFSPLELLNTIERLLETR